MGCFPAITFGNYGGLLRYIGDGETTDKGFLISYSPDSLTRYAAIDACANGGLSIGGGIALTESKMHQFYLTGSNAAPCEVTGPLVNSGDYTFHLSKFGTGQWNLRHNDATTWSGALTVGEGTLGFDTVAEKGTVSALGTAMRTQSSYAGAYNEAKDVPWAVKIEDGAALEYLGTTNCAAATRPIVVTGTGTVKNNGGGYLRLAGFSVLSDATDSTLVLGGTNTLDNVADDLSDGHAGKLSVVKEDVGTWRLGTNCTFTGALDVKAGKLVMGNLLYRYYRWVIKATFTTLAGSSKDRVVGLTTFGLFDADGNDLTYGFTDETPADNLYGDYKASYPYAYDVFGTGQRGRLAVPSAGHFVVTRYSGLSKGFHSRVPDTLFTHAASNIGNYWSRTPQEPPTPESTDSWWAITMQLQDGNPATSWDYVTSPCQYSYQMISNSTLEASVDGIVWQELAEVINDEMNMNGKWQSNSETYDSAYVTHVGMPIPAGSTNAL